MALITLLGAQLAYGHVPLLDRADFSLEANERVGLIGRNGAGKSSLLKILAGLEKPDDGQLQLQAGLSVAYVAQTPDLPQDATVFEAVRGALSSITALVERYLAHAPGEDLDALQTQIEAQDGWNCEQRVAETLARLGLDGAARVGDLSGGVKKRVALAQALVARPDVLLLDEPTNHLDLQAIAWLEELLIAFKGSVVVITHDRAFLDRVVQRIVELDRGKLQSYPGNFSAYQNLKEEQLAQEAVINARADKLLAQEEVWIRKGVEARRTRAQGRITRLVRLREARAARREAVGRVRLDVAEGSRSGKLVAELQAVTHGFGDAPPVVKNLSTLILRGDKIGLIGPNGAGKTTLLKLILGELQAQSGQVRQGSNLQVAYFDQMRQALDPEATLEDFISPGSEWIEIGEGAKARRQHVKSYLGDFLFSPARAASPVKSLSGGERARLLLARLFARPANVLVLDEPTNDLDIDTLELLEDLLQNYEGTVFLVSHDRAFLNNVVTSTLVAEGNGLWREYEGGVQDWLTQAARAPQAPAAGPAPAPKAASAPSKPEIEPQIGSQANKNVRGQLSKKKLSYKEQRQLDAIPGQLAALETEQTELRQRLSDASIYTRDPQTAAALHARDAAIDDEMLALMERQETLGG